MGASQSQKQLIRSLKMKKFRDQHAMFVVEGRKLVEEALQSQFEVKTLFRTSDSQVKTVEGFNAIVEVSNQEIQQLSSLKSPPHELALVGIPEKEVPLQSLLDQRVVVLDGIRDPGNLGTIIRSADWFGIRHIIVSEDTVDIYNPKVVQASMGSIFRVAISCRSIESTIEQIKALDGRFPMFRADMVGEHPRNLNTDRGLLVMGNEAHGVRPSTRKLVPEAISIPAEGGAESLNVAIAMSILCYQWSL